jgi:hypothetical protein
MAMYRRGLGALTVVAAGALVSTLAARASACSPPLCPSPVRLAPTHYLPGNLIYFQISGDDPAAIALRTADGEPVAASIRTIGADRVFAPEQPIAEGTQLVLEYSLECLSGPSPGTLQQTFEFMATAPGEIELNPAQLVIEEIGVRYPDTDNEAGFVRVRHAPGDANGNASSLMIHTYTIDGIPTSGQANGSPGLVEVIAPCHQPIAGAQIDTCGTFIRAPAGLHTVEVSTHIVGATTQPGPVRLEVDVQCPETDAADPSGEDELQPSPPDLQMAGSSETIPDSAATLDPDSVIYTAGDDAALPEPVAAPVAASSGGGCALGSSGAPAEGGGLLALVATFMLARARRRAPRSQ